MSAADRTRPAAMLRQFEEAFKFGHRFAAVSALDVCTAAHLPLPQWASLAVRKILVSALQTKPDVRAWLADQKNLQRYRAVLKHLDNGAKWTDAYADAADDSIGHEWHGGAHTMKIAYDEVNRAIKRTPGRYWRPQDAVDAVNKVFKAIELLPTVMRDGKPINTPSGWSGLLYSPPETKK
jgi:hypothetical protein